MKIKATIDVIEEAERLSKETKSNIHPGMIDFCIKHSGLVLDEDWNIALTNPFKEDNKYRQDTLFSGMVLCGGEIVAVDKSLITLEFHPSRSYEQRFNLSQMKHVEMRILQLENVKTDKDGCIQVSVSVEYKGHHFSQQRPLKLSGTGFVTVPVIRRARLVPKLEEIKIDKMQELDRNLQPSVMLI